MSRTISTTIIRNSIKSKNIRLMSFFKHKSDNNEDIPGGGDSSMFGLTLNQFTELMGLRGKEFMDKLNSPPYNGVEGILEKLKVDKNKGLDPENKQDLEQRRVAYGKNQTRIKHASCIPFTSEWKTQREFRHAREEHEKTDKTIVLRDNHLQEILDIDIVVGDICLIKYGAYLPADGVVIEADDLKIDESSMTGESGLIKKNVNEDAILLSGTQVMEGSGKMVVTAVGFNSQFGIVLNILSQKKPD